jgi:type IV pilus assembly protein PilZ
MSKVSLEYSDEAAAAERRRSIRADLIVRVDYATVDEMFSEFTRDINEGGLFIETEKPRPVGTDVTLHFNLPGSDEMVITVGRVVRHSPGGGNAPPGMGIEFDELSSDDRVKIDSIIRALRIGSRAD